METCFVLVKGIKCPAHCTLAQNRTLAHWHIGSLKCRISQKRKMEPNIQKIIWPNQSRDKRLAKFCRKETKLINFSPSVSRHCHCPQNCKKEISGSPKKSNKAESRSKGMRAMGPLGADFSRRQYQTLGACSLGKNGHCGTNLQCKLDMRRPRMAS